MGKRGRDAKDGAFYWLGGGQRTSLAFPGLGILFFAYTILLFQESDK